MSKLISKLTPYIETNKGIIQQLIGDKIFTKINGKDVRHKGLKVSITFKNRQTFANNLEMAIIQHHKIGTIDLFKFGYENCPKCNGTGILKTNIDNGVCWKCNGFSIIKSK